MALEKYDGYWQEGIPYIDEAEFKIFADTDAALMELKAGTVDIMQYLSEDQASALGDDFEILEGNVNYVQGLFLNNQYEPFQDVRVRRALCYAVDKELINEFLFSGKSHIIGTNMIPAFSKYYDKGTETIPTMWRRPENYWLRQVMRMVFHWKLQSPAIILSMSAQRRLWWKV